MEKTRTHGALPFLLSFVIRVLRIIITINKNLELISTNDYTLRQDPVITQGNDVKELIHTQVMMS